MTRINQVLTWRNRDDWHPLGHYGFCGYLLPHAGQFANGRYFVIFRILIHLGFGLLLTSCTGVAKFDSTPPEIPIPAEQSRAVLTDTDQCRIALQTKPTAATHSLDQSHIRLLNWNTHKNTDAYIQADLARLTDGVDLILLQESVRDSAAFADIDPAFQWSFSPGYQRASLSTGVATGSRIQPLARCSLTNYEP